MKKLNQISHSEFLKLIFWFFTVAFLVAASAMPDRRIMFSGLRNIITQTSKVTTNCFALGGYSGAFLNVGLVCLFCSLLYELPKAEANAPSVVAFLLTVGFAFWGINILNMWFGMFGVLLYCLIKRVPVGTQVNALLFTTALSPLYSDMLLRYPYDNIVGIHWQGILLAIGVGLVVGFFLPAGLAFAPKVHQGYSLYSAALPLGMTAFILYGLLYTVLNVEVPAGPSSGLLIIASAPIVNIFCCALFALCVIIALLMGCTPKDYWQLMKDSGHNVNFAEKYGNAAALMNVGVYGLFIMLYYNLIGATFNAVTLGCVFCMLACCDSGSHPRNVLPIMIGYVLISFVMKWLAIGEYAQNINAQSIVVGLCFANGLSPVSGKYGWHCGILAGMLHFCLVTSVPNLHGGFCLYNGGYTDCFITLILIPVLQSFCKTREERAALKRR